jgi:hypothetical protein
MLTRRGFARDCILCDLRGYGVRCDRCIGGGGRALGPSRTRETRSDHRSSKMLPMPVRPIVIT